MLTLDQKWGSLRELYQWNRESVILMISLALCMALIGTIIIMVPVDSLSMGVVAKGIGLFSAAVVAFLCLLILCVPADGVSRSIVFPLFNFYGTMCMGVLCVLVVIAKGFLHHQW